MKTELKQLMEMNANNMVTIYDGASNKWFKYTREEYDLLLKNQDMFRPHPQKEPVDWKALSEDIYKRHSKSFAKLAKN